MFGFGLVQEGLNVDCLGLEISSGKISMDIGLTFVPIRLRPFRLLFPFGSEHIHRFAKSFLFGAKGIHRARYCVGFERSSAPTWSECALVQSHRLEKLSAF